MHLTQSVSNSHVHLFYSWHYKKIEIVNSLDFEYNSHFKSESSVTLERALIVASE